MKKFNSEEMCPLCVHKPECDKLAEEVAEDGNFLPHCGGKDFEDKREPVPKGENYDNRKYCKSNHGKGN